ncbi:MAG: DAK2 domain-containing protein, partial [Pseudobutyrivibrio sp.]|nr:DAK2 domain-containing protein [Pseudobutyrivibrio sp.]
MATRVYECLKAISDKIIANKDFLTDLDREIGDADHGVNMARGFQAVIEKVPEDEADIGAALKKTGMTLLSTVGGASGPLYGTAYMEVAKIFAGKETV